MIRLSLILSALLAGPVAAQEPLRQRPAEDAPTPNVFLSPAGEPFRAAEDAPYPVATWFGGADADRNGRVNFAEFEADALRFFAALDADKDGRLGNLEVVAYETEVAPEILAPAPAGRRARPADRRSVGSMISPRGTKKLPPHLTRKGAGRYGLLNEPQPVAAADVDFNAIVTKDEWSQAARRRFTRLDANGDRQLTADELPATPAQVLLQD
jgi:hypothetical protein